MDLALGSVLLVVPGVAGVQYPFRNTSLPFDARVKPCMQVLSLREKTSRERERERERGAECFPHTFNCPPRTMASKVVTCTIPP